MFCVDELFERICAYLSIRYLFPIDDLSRKLGTSLDEIPIPLPRKSKAIASLTTTSATAGDSLNAGQKSGSKTTPGSAQTVKALGKADETKKEAGQRRASGLKYEKLLKVSSFLVCCEGFKVNEELGNF